MSRDPSQVIVSERLCHCQAVHVHRVHHHEFPEVHAEDVTLRGAALSLAGHLARALDSVASDRRREALERALADVRGYIEHVPDEPPAAPASVDIVELVPDAPEARRSGTLLKTRALEVFRMAVPAGAEVPSHRVHGEATIQCLRGRVALKTGDNRRELHAGQLVHLGAGVPHAVVGLEDASLLVTVVRDGSQPQ